MKKLKLRLNNERIIKQLTEAAKKDPIGTLDELIFNSFDAGSKNIDIMIEKISGDIKIIDDGCGMSVDEINENLLNIGNDKRSTGHENNVVDFIGRKGLGKLSIMGLCKKVIIHTKKKTSPKAYQLEIDNEDYVDASEQIKLNFNEKTSIIRILKSGTEVILKNCAVNFPEEDTYYLRLLSNKYRTWSKSSKVNIKFNGVPLSETFIQNFYSPKTANAVILINNPDMPEFIDTLIEKIDKSSVIRNETLLGNGKINGYVIMKNKSAPKGHKWQIGLYCKDMSRSSDVIDTDNKLHGVINYESLDSENDCFNINRTEIIKGSAVHKEIKIVEKYVKNEINKIIKKQATNEENYYNQIKKIIAPKFMGLGDTKDFMMTLAAEIKEIDIEAKSIGFDKLPQTLRQEISERSSKNIKSYRQIFIMENLIRHLLKTHCEKNDDYEKIKIHMEKEKYMKNPHYLLDEGANKFQYGATGELFTSLRELGYGNYIDSELEEFFDIRNKIMHTQSIKDMYIDVIKKLYRNKSIEIIRTIKEISKTRESNNPQER